LKEVGFQKKWRILY